MDATGHNYATRRLRSASEARHVIIVTAAATAAAAAAATATRAVRMLTLKTSFITHEFRITSETTTTATCQRNSCSI